VNEITLAELLSEEHLFYRVPENWHIVITDVRGSSQAVARGLHETVNLVATGSIVAVLNIAAKHSFTIPYFFGGDGATFIVPPSILEEVLRSLTVHRNNTLNSFSLDLRVGCVPVSDAYARGHGLMISKLRASNTFVIPVILGEGLSFAEKIIKKDDYALSIEIPEDHELDLSGMQCRWDRVAPPENADEVVSLLVVTPHYSTQATAFRKVISLVDEIYGEPRVRKPITITRLKLKATLGKIMVEMKTRFGKRKTLYLLRTWLTSLLGTLYFRTLAGRTYLSNLVEMSDTLVVDGKINTVISGTETQRNQLASALDKLETAGEIKYGLHVSRESVMSCYVRDLKEDHVHFVDGAEGGYTQAAIVLKKKLTLPVAGEIPG
jgi:hypothetical protein